MRALKSSPRRQRGYIFPFLPFITAVSFIAAHDTAVDHADCRKTPEACQTTVSRQVPGIVQGKTNTNIYHGLIDSAVVDDSPIDSEFELTSH